MNTPYPDMLFWGPRCGSDTVLGHPCPHPGLGCQGQQPRDHPPIQQHCQGIGKKCETTASCITKAHQNALNCICSNVSFFCFKILS